MTSYAITATAPERYADALTQFERLRGCLSHVKSQRMPPR
jgi:hypothetical protein